MPSTAVCYTKTFIEVREVGGERPQLRRECSEPWAPHARFDEDGQAPGGARVFPDTPSGVKGGLGLGGWLSDVVGVPPSPPRPAPPCEQAGSGSTTPVFSPQMPVAACEAKCGLAVVDTSPPGSPSEPPRATPVCRPAVPASAGVPFVPLEAPPMLPWAAHAMPCPHPFEFGRVPHCTELPQIVMVPIPVPMPPAFQLLPSAHGPAASPANAYEVPQAEMSCGAGAAAPQGLFLEARLPTGRVERAQRGALAGDSSAKVFVGGLGPMTTSERLHEYFAAYGTVSDAVVIADTLTRRSRGFGFVTFGGGIPQGLLELQHVIDQRRCGVREYTYGEGKAAEVGA